MIPWKYVLSGLLALGFSTNVDLHEWRSLDPAVLHQMANEAWVAVGGSGEFSLDGLVDALALEARESINATAGENISGEFDRTAVLHEFGSLEAAMDALRDFRASLRIDAKADTGIQITH